MTATILWEKTPFATEDIIPKPQENNPREPPFKTARLFYGTLRRHRNLLDFRRQSLTDSCSRIRMPELEQER